MTRPASHRHRILVVDDYPDAVEIAAALLEARGHECRGAHTGEQAIREAARFDPEIVILDFRLPDMTGYEVASRLRSTITGHALHITALTGTTLEFSDLQAAGIDRCVRKPANLDELIAAAEQSLHSKSA